MINIEKDNTTRLVAITCNCGTARSFLKRRVPQVAALLGSEDDKYLINYEHYRLGDLLRNNRMTDIKEMSKKAGAYDFLTRPGRNSDKILVLPSMTYIDLRLPDTVLMKNNKKQLEELYEITRIK